MIKKPIRMENCKVKVLLAFSIVLSAVLCITCSSNQTDGELMALNKYHEVVNELKKKYPDPTKMATSETYEDYFLKDTTKHSSLFEILKNDHEAIYFRMAALSTIIGRGLQSSISKKAYAYALNADKFQGYDQMSQLAGMGLNSCFLLDDSIMKKWFQIWKTLDWTPRSNLINVLYDCGMGNDIPKTYLLDAISVSNGPRGRSLLIIKEKETLDSDYRDVLQKILVSDQIRPVIKKEVQEVLDKFDN